MNFPGGVSLPPVTLVLGGARSGKSAYAERLVEACGGGFYLATAEAGDAEMAERIRHHQERRGDNWSTIEETLDIHLSLKEFSAPGKPVLVECLTLWLSNLTAAERDLDASVTGLIEVIGDLPGPVVLVSNEVGLGICPDNKLAREFVDNAGQLNRLVAMAADRVVFSVAGLPMTLKDIKE